MLSQLNQYLSGKIAFSLGDICPNVGVKGKESNKLVDLGVLWINTAVSKYLFLEDSTLKTSVFFLLNPHNVYHL